MPEGFRVATAFVEIQARGLPAVESSLGALRSEMSAFATAATGLGAVFTTGALGLGLAYSVKAFGEAEEAGAKLDAVLKATKGAAGLTGDQISAMCSDLQRVTTFEDDVSRGAASMLLTFKEIKGDTFRQALMAAQDLSVVMGQDLKSSVLQIGKALQDPITGITALRRAGVSFDEQQRDQIKSLVENNRLLDAQKMILAELSSEFGGAAAAAADTMTGRIQQMKNAWGDLAEVVGSALAGPLKGAAEWMTKQAQGPTPQTPQGAVEGAAKSGQLSAIREMQKRLIEEERGIIGDVQGAALGLGRMMYTEEENRIKEIEAQLKKLEAEAQKLSGGEFAKKAALSVLGVPGNAPPISKNDAAAAIAGAAGGTKPPDKFGKEHDKLPDFFKTVGGWVKEGKKIREEGLRVLRQTATSDEKFGETIKHIRDVQGRGGLSADEAAKAIEAQRGDFIKAGLNGANVESHRMSLSDMHAQVQAGILKSQERDKQTEQLSKKFDELRERLDLPIKIDDSRPVVLGD